MKIPDTKSDPQDRRRRRPRAWLVGLLTWPLLQNLTCSERATIAIVEGVFAAFNDYLADTLQELP